MPELPEVESFRRYVEDHALHQKIKGIKLFTSNMLWNTTAKAIEEVLEGNVFVGTRRHGKMLFLQLRKKGFLLLHFGMTGNLSYLQEKHTRKNAFILRIDFDNNHTLLFLDPRMLGKIALVDDIEAFIQNQKYGPDAIQVSETEFFARFINRKSAIKTALMNQKILAGLGNEFSDALLFKCSIHPLSPVPVIPKEQLGAIFHLMKRILKEAIQVNADRDKLNHYFLLNQRKAGLECPRCDGKTSFLTIGGRSSYFCPSCQILYSKTTK